MISKLIELISTVLISTFVLVLVLLALYVSLGRYYVPLLTEYRVPIIKQLSVLSGLQISLTDLQGEWHRWAPIVRLRNLQVSELQLDSHNGESSTVLKIAYLEVSFDVLGSIRSLGLRVRNLQTNDVELNLHQNDSGRWSMVGLQPSKKPAISDSLIDPLLDVRALKLSNTTINLVDNQGNKSGFDSIDFSLSRKGGFRRIVLSAANANSSASVKADISQPAKSRKKSLVASIETIGDPRHLTDFTAKAYFSLKELQIPTSAILITGIPALVQSSSQDKPLQSLSGDFWLDWDSASTSYLQGEIAIPTLSVTDQRKGENVAVENVKGSFFIERIVNDSGQGEWQSWIPSLQLDLNQKPVTLIDHLHLNISPLGADSLISLKTDMANVAVLNQIMLSTGLLNETLQEIFSTLRPDGYLKQFSLQVASSKTLFKEYFKANGFLTEINLLPWRGIPGGKGINGYIEANLLQGSFDLQTTDFAILLPTVYSHWLKYENVAGFFTWQIIDQRLAIDSDMVNLQGLEGNASLSLFLDLPLKKGGAEPLLSLVVGVPESNLDHVDKYLPKFLKQEILDWLSNSIDSGVISNIGFAYDGSLKKGGKPKIQLFLDVQGVDVKYHPDWPAVKNVKGFFSMRNKDIDVIVDSAKIYDSDITQTLVQLRTYKNEKNIYVKVNGKINGDAADGLRVINESPVKQQIGDFVETWQAGGAMQMILDLSIPLNAQNSTHEPEVSLDLELQDSFFRMRDENLLFVGINGEISFSLTQGLNSSGIEAILLRKPVHTVIKTQVRDGRHNIWINLKGNVESKHLMEWVKQPALAFLEGEMGYEAQVVVNPTGQSFVKVDTDLKNVTIDLPKPYGKTFGTPRGASFYVDLGGDELLYEINMADMLQMSFLQSQGVLTGGHIYFGEERPTVSRQEIIVTGRQNEFFLDEWLKVLDAYKDVQTKLGLGQGPSLPIEVDNVRVNDLHAFDRHLQDVDVNIRYFSDTDGFWRINLLGATATGDIDIFDDNRPYRVAMEYLDLKGLFDFEDNQVSTDNGNDNKSSPATKLTAAVNPGKFPAVNFKVKNLRYGDEHYGCWSFSLRPSGNSAIAANLIAHVKGLSLGAFDINDKRAKCDTVLASNNNVVKDLNVGDRLRWSLVNNASTVGTYETAFNAAIQTNQLGEAMDYWGYERILESKSAQFQISAVWPGEPSDFELANTSANMKFILKDGSFVTAPNSASNASKVVSFLNLDKMIRRLQLDFSDLTKKGLSFDKIEGEVVSHDGKIRVIDDILVQGSSSEIHVSGVVDVRERQVNNQMVVTLPIADNLPWLVGLAGGIPIAAGAYVVSKVLRKQVDALSSAVYSVKGKWESPDVKFEHLFSVKPMDTSVEQALENKPSSLPAALPIKDSNGLPSQLKPTVIAPLDLRGRNPGQLDPSANSDTVM